MHGFFLEVWIWWALISDANQKIFTLRNNNQHVVINTLKLFQSIFYNFISFFFYSFHISNNFSPKKNSERVFFYLFIYKISLCQLIIKIFWKHILPNEKAKVNICMQYKRIVNMVKHRVFPKHSSFWYLYEKSKE